jgi:hypothetical protein
MLLPFRKMIRHYLPGLQRHRTGSYLTDGQRLFRVVTPFSPYDESPVGLLEDCRTLEVTPFSPDELCEMGLSLVRVGRGGVVSRGKAVRRHVVGCGCLSCHPA